MVTIKMKATSKMHSAARWVSACFYTTTPNEDDFFSFMPAHTSIARSRRVARANLRKAIAGVETCNRLGEVVAY